MTVSTKVINHLKRQLWCAVFACEAFKAAKLSSELYVSMQLSENHPLHYTFVSSVVTTYAKSFIKADNMGTLPRRFFKLPTETLRATHEALITARNAIYAHTDATEKPHAVTIRIEARERGIKANYEATAPLLKGIVFPRVIDLCEFQIEQAHEVSSSLVERLYPPDVVLKVLKAERSFTTKVEVFWPGSA